MINKHIAFAINLYERPDRLAHIKKVFSNKPEFTFQALSFQKKAPSTLALWNNVIEIINIAKKNGQEYVIICEDDHKFTTAYNDVLFTEMIAEAKIYHADVLIGGVSWFKSAIQISPRLFWVDKFSGLQFTLIFSKFYDTLLSAKFLPSDTADHKISSLTDHKLVIFPFMSIQQDFGYSDVTYKNDILGNVAQLFASASEIINQLIQVKKFYKSIPIARRKYIKGEFDHISIPLYLILQTGKPEEQDHVKLQFKDKTEFELTIIDADCFTNERKLWESITGIIQGAINNVDDMVIICTGDHEFTEHYNKEVLFQHIITAHELGADLISGGVGNFGQIVPIDIGKYWVNPILSAQFIIVYQKFYHRILNYKFQEDDVTTTILSELTSHKILLFPFLSKLKTWEKLPKKRFDYVMENGDIYSADFQESYERIATIARAEKEYGL